MWHIHPHDLDKCARRVASAPTQQCSWFSGTVRSVGSNAQMQCSYREAHVPAWLVRRRAANTAESWTATGRFFRRWRRSAERCWSMTRPWVESGPTSTPVSTHTQHSYTRLVTEVLFMHDRQMTVVSLVQLSTMCLTKRSHFNLSVTLSNLNRSSKFLHCWKAYEICYKIDTCVCVCVCVCVLTVRQWIASNSHWAWHARGQVCPCWSTCLLSQSSGRQHELRESPDNGHNNKYSHWEQNDRKTELR